jgi:GNAT superfamily N-acetyltransferase
MTSVDDFRPARVDRPDVRLDEIRDCPPSFFRYLYREVGRQYHWVDRLAWSDRQVIDYVASPRLKLFVLYATGAPAGYFELWRHDDGAIEVAYFGLLPEFVGQGLGKLLLTEAVERAWAERTPRIWLHTCSLDHPGALANYIARGFTPYREEHYEVPPDPDMP